MRKRELSEDTKNKVNDFIDSLYLDVQGATGTGATKLSEEYIIRLITKFVVSLGTAFWSISELMGYIRNRRSMKEFVL